MKPFATAILAATAAATSYLDFSINIDGTDYAKKLSSKDWSSATVSGTSVTIAGNNSLFLRESESLDDAAIYKPLVRGGSISYTVNVGGMGSGCVAGVYLVETDTGACGERDQGSNSNPQCRGIDAMQANNYGFETKAHPCTNGTCDAISQCIAGA